MTRCLSIALCKRTGWDSVLNLSRDCVTELFFWNKNLGNLPSSKITRFNKTPSKILFSDASEFAGAGYSIEQDTKIVHYMWSDWEKSKSSTWRELKAICVLIESLCNDLSGRLVMVYTDNQNSVLIACKGSMNNELHSLH